MDNIKGKEIFYGDKKVGTIDSITTTDQKDIDKFQTYIGMQTKSMSDVMMQWTEDSINKLLKPWQRWILRKPIIRKIGRLFRYEIIKYNDDKKMAYRIEIRHRGKVKAQKEFEYVLFLAGAVVKNPGRDFDNEYMSEQTITVKDELPGKFRQDI